MHDFYPRTPIRIIDGQVFAWLWNGRETRDGKPVVRLGKPRIGHSKNGRLMSLPYRNGYVQELSKGGAA